MPQDAKTSNAGEQPTPSKLPMALVTAISHCTLQAFLGTHFSERNLARFVAERNKNSRADLRSPDRGSRDSQASVRASRIRILPSAPRNILLSSIILPFAFLLPPSTLALVPSVQHRNNDAA
jgi:hypothetical protein